MRVVQRVYGESLNESRMASELQLARLVGIDDRSRAYAAVLEVGDRFCWPQEPQCGVCPLQRLCLMGRKDEGKRKDRS